MANRILRVIYALKLSWDTCVLFVTKAWKNKLEICDRDGNIYFSQVEMDNLLVEISQEDNEKGISPCDAQCGDVVFIQTDTGKLAPFSCTKPARSLPCVRDEGTVDFDRPSGDAPTVEAADDGQ